MQLEDEDMKLPNIERESRADKKRWLAMDYLEN